MHPLRRPACSRPPLWIWPATASLALSLTACANGPATPQASAAVATVTHNCKPQETVGFSCELRDHRLLSLCASPGFEKFTGLTKDNPGYAYLVVGTPQGQVQYSYPDKPSEYRKYLSSGTTMSAWPYVKAMTQKGTFFYANGDAETPVSLTPENLPPGWHVEPAPTRGDSYCANRVHRENFDAVLLQLPPATN